MLSDLYNEEKIIRIGMENVATEARKAGQTSVLQLLRANGMISPEQLVELQNQLAACNADAARVTAKQGTHSNPQHV